MGIRYWRLIQWGPADPGSQKDLLHVDQPFANHNEALAFGPDGMLYGGCDGGRR
jgi:hypothetical protein